VLTENEGYFDMHFAKPKNDYGASVPLSDSATSRAMRLEESPGDVATKLGEGLYVAQQPPPHQVIRNALNSYRYSSSTPKLQFHLCSSVLFTSYLSNANQARFSSLALL
jgi:hypothetical protein